MINSRLKKIIHEIGLDYGLTDKQVEDILRAEFEMVAEKIKNSHESRIRYPIMILKGFAKFVPKFEYQEKRKQYERDTAKL